VLTDFVTRTRQNLSTGETSSLSRWILTYAETSAADTAFAFPIRLVSAVVVSCLLVLGGLATIDFWALRMTRSIESIEQTYNVAVVPAMRGDHPEGEDGIVDQLLTQLSPPGFGSAFHNSYFDSGAELSPHAARPSFNALDEDCPCSPFSALQTVAADIGPHLMNAVNSQNDDAGRRTQAQEIEQVRDTLQDPGTGVTIKCMVQQLRTIWEPLPFCIRYAGIISMCIGAVSTVLFLLHFRRSALRLRELVEEHFDPVHGAPAYAVQSTVQLPR